MHNENVGDFCPYFNMITRLAHIIKTVLSYSYYRDNSGLIKNLIKGTAVHRWLKPIEAQGLRLLVGVWQMFTDTNTKINHGSQVFRLMTAVNIATEQLFLQNCVFFFFFEFHFSSLHFSGLLFNGKIYCIKQKALIKIMKQTILHQFIKSIKKITCLGPYE